MSVHAVDTPPVNKFRGLTAARVGCSRATTAGAACSHATGSCRLMHRHEETADQRGGHGPPPVARPKQGAGVGREARQPADRPASFLARVVRRTYVAVRPGP